MPFRSYYWNPDLIGEIELRVQLSKFLSASTTEEIQEAFAALLRSNSQEAQGIALDNYFYQASLGRFGAENPLNGYVPEMLSIARKELSRPPLTQSLENGAVIQGANHASALGLLFHAGDASDLPAVRTILLGSSDVNVLTTAALALTRIVKLSPSDGPLLSRLNELVSGNGWPQDLRTFAFGALSAATGPEVSRYLTQVARKTELPYSAYAAEALIDRELPELHRLLQDIVSRWPEDAPFPANDVRRRLAEIRGEKDARAKSPPSLN